LAYAVLAQVEVASARWVSADDLYRQALAADSDKPDVLHSPVFGLGPPVDSRKRWCCRKTAYVGTIRAVVQRNHR
jgi:hypothetical protein